MALDGEEERLRGTSGHVCCTGWRSAARNFWLRAVVDVRHPAHLVDTHPALMLSPALNLPIAVPLPRRCTFIRAPANLFRFELLLGAFLAARRCSCCPWQRCRKSMMLAPLWRIVLVRMCLRVSKVWPMNSVRCNTHFLILPNRFHPSCATHLLTENHVAVRRHNSAF